MVARDLIESIFSRPAWRGTPGNVRRITRDQLVYLRNLIEADPEAEAVKRGAPGSLVWMPSGRYKFVLTEDLIGDKHTLTKLSNIVASKTGMLF
jgi:hypothetical protein